MIIKATAVGGGVRPREIVINVHLIEAVEAVPGENMPEGTRCLVRMTGGSTFYIANTADAVIAAAWGAAAVEAVA